VLRDIGAVSDITLPSLPKMIDCGGREDVCFPECKGDRTSLTCNLIPMLSGNPSNEQVLRGTTFCNFTFVAISRQDAGTTGGDLERRSTRMSRDADSSADPGSGLHGPVTQVD
jgi:hypothetical protein